jgi:hypothetical protein
MAGLDPPRPGVPCALGVEGYKATPGQHADEIYCAFAHRNPRHPTLAAVRTGGRGDEIDTGAALLPVAGVQVLQIFLEETAAIGVSCHWAFSYVLCMWNA